MSNARTGIVAHDNAVLAAEGIRQAAIAAFVVSGEAATTLLVSPQAPGGVTPQNGLQRATVAAEITYNRTCLASARANGANPSPYMEALRNLGTGGC